MRHEITKTLAVVEYGRKMAAKKSCKREGHGLFKSWLFLFAFFFRQEEAVEHV